MNSSLKRQLFKTFSQMIADFKNTAEIEKFLTDFFNDKELETYIKRISTAYWLKKGRSPENIKVNLKTSAKEIKTARLFLTTAGGKLAIKKMEAEEWANKWVEKFNEIKNRN